MTHTVESIRALLATNDTAVIRALLALNARQTPDEVRLETTKYHNNVGFTAGHAKRGTGMVKFYQRTGRLTAKQLAWWRQVMPSGRSRIGIYAAQLLDIAEAKASARDSGDQLKLAA